MPDDKSFQLIRDMLRGLQESIDKLDTKLDGRMDKVDGRVRKLEFWRNGICAVGVFVVTAFSAALRWWDK